MKAADLKIGGEYFYTEGSWDTDYKAVVIEAPVVGWKVSHRYGYSRRIEGQEDVGGKRDHAIVKLFRRDWRGDEGGTKFQHFQGIKRVLLRNIKEPFDQYQELQERAAEMERQDLERENQRKARAEALNVSLEHLGLKLRRNYTRIGWTLETLDGGAEDLLDKLEDLVSTLAIETKELDPDTLADGHVEPTDASYPGGEL